MNNTKRLNTNKLTHIIYLGYFLVGLLTIVIAPTLPFIIKDYELSLTNAGLIFSARSIGSLIGVLAGGILSDVFGRKLLVIISYFLQTLALIMIASISSWLAILIFFSFSGMSLGLSKPTMNALVAELNVDRRGGAVNTLHGIYSVGALIGPVIMGYSLSRGISWIFIYYFLAFLSLIFVLVNISVSYPEFEVDTDKFKNLKLKKFIKNRAFIILFLISFIYNGSATALVGWINTYMEQIDFPTLLGAGMVSIFYIGLAGGRFVFGVYSEKIGYLKLIFYCTLGAAIFYPLTIFSSFPSVIIIGTLFSGFFLSGLYPTAIAYVNRLFSNMAATVTGFLAVSMSLGAMVVPWATGFLADIFDFRAGLSIGFILILVSVLSSWYLKRISLK